MLKPTGQREYVLPSRGEIIDEAMLLMAAGSDTTANTLTFATYHFLRLPEVRRKVLKELFTVQKNENGRLPLKDLEALPYFVSWL